MNSAIRVDTLVLLVTGASSLAPSLGGAQDGEVVIGYAAPSLVGAQLEIQQGLVDQAEAKG
jgi:hypothetical protein